MIAIDVLKWPGMNQAFLVSLLVSVLMIVGVVIYGKRRPVGKPLDWGEAMVGSIYIFLMLFITYGIMPHQWITHADADLAWTKDKIIYGPGDILQPESLGGWLPLTLQYEAVRDTVVVLLHAVFFGAHIWLAIWWQKRGEEKPKEIATSTYGRPLVKEGVSVMSSRRPMRAAVRRGASVTIRSARPGGAADGEDRRQPADDAVHRRLHVGGGRRGLPDEGRQAEAVHPHRPVRVHHVRGMCRHLPVEVHPHGARPMRSTRHDRHRAARRPTPPTRSCSSSTTTSAPAARSAWTVARPGVIILGKAGAGDGRRRVPTSEPTTMATATA